MFEALVRRGIIVTVAVLIVSVLGVLAALRIPVQMIPDLEVRVIGVETRWPGATPQDVEKEILIEQERYLRAIPSLERMISTASYGSARIDLEFPFGTDINEALIRVNNALSQVPSYPENVDEPSLEASSFSQNSFMYFRIVPLEGNPLDLDVRLMYDFLDDNVRPRMERVEGVSRINIWGGAERQVRILIDPAALAERNLTLDEVRSAIRARNRDISAGDVELGKRRYLLRTIGRFDRLEDLQDLILARQGDSLVRLSDVAEVELSYYEIRQLSYANGQPSMTIAVNREPGSNVIDIKRALLPVVEDINREVLAPAGLRMSLSSDDVRYVQASVANVWQNLILGAVLATLVMFFFLRSLGATVVGVVGVPICTIAAFLGLLAAGRTINVISLAGVAFAVGMTLDNSIVVLEAIERRRREGLDRLAAAIDGVRQVWPAVLASTLTTVLVFAPIFFIEQEAGQLYSDVAVAISASILASMLVAIAVVPTLSARLNFGVRDAGRAHGHALRDRILAAVTWLIDSSARRLTTLAVVVLAVLGIILTLTPPAEYLPEGEEPKTFASMIAPPGYNLAEMQEIGEQVEAYLLPFVGDDPARYERGEVPVPALAYLSLSVSTSNIRVLAETVDPGQINALMDVLTDYYRQFPGMRAFAARGSIISSNDGGTRSVNLDITGRDLVDIYRVARLAYARAETLFDNPRLGSSPSSLSLDQPLVEIRPDWTRAAEMGMSASDIGFAVAALTDGAFVDEYFQGDDKIDIFLFSQAGNQQQLDRIDALPIYVPGAGVVPLGSLAEVVETVDTDAIRRLNGRRTVTLNIIPPRSVALESALETVQAEVVDWLRSEGHLSDDMSLDISGASDQLMETRAALGSNYLVAILLCFLVMVAIFGHWGWPVVILTAVPLGIAGGIGGLALLNGLGALLPMIGGAAVSQPFDMITMLGFLILLGVVVNNPILIVDRTLANLRTGTRDPVEAVREAVATRIRPIMMSMITTLFGLAPLVFIPGEGTELYRGVGVVVLAGLLFATLVTLTFLPALLVSLLKLRERWAS
ncbi:efflux RND transporter permease subunit [Wenzhouxiangella marina]|uniref:Acriflavin resistance protein n=1 Tax=Wenzhouxiangella marina TaxID=1579979 RepID=A0A0K0XSG0_9GAMM|nr:efflux RND transporter permease subunit [Wenzhouxiangella marina]AKS40595.1 acriflavin resistance protein [Wenzhouxiangella marina]MBB6088363.1 multidrug efflux pump subunit AcrB [Wenzhouxiangella marina]